METVTVNLRGLDVDIWVEIDEGKCVLEEVLTTVSISEETASFLYFEFEQELTDLADAKLDEVRAERKVEEAATKKREVDKKHKTFINGSIKDALVLSGIDSKQATLAIKAIALDKIPHILIRY